VKAMIVAALSQNKSSQKKPGSKKLLGVGQRSKMIRQKRYQRRRHKNSKDEFVVSPKTTQVDDNPDKNVTTKPQDKEDGNHQDDGDEGNDGGEDDNNEDEDDNNEDEDDNNEDNEGNEYKEDDDDNKEDNEGNEYKEDNEGPNVQPTNTTQRRSSTNRRVAQKIIPLQCSTRNGTNKPRRSKRAKSTTLDTRKPKSAHIPKNNDNNHEDQKKGKKRQRSRSRRSRPISQFYSQFYSSDDDDDEDDEDDHHDVDDDDRYQPSQTCIGVYGKVMCRVPCQVCASRFQHYPSLVSVDVSYVHGYGVFATQDIEEDTFLLQFVAREVPSCPNKFTLKYDGRIFDWEGTTGVHKLINHNCETGPFEPNARIDMWRNQHDQEIMSIISNRDIGVDEEIFIHFGKDFLWPEPCRCPNCIHHYDVRRYTKPRRRHSW